MGKLYGSVSRTVWKITAFSPADISVDVFTAKYHSEYGDFTFRPYTIALNTVSTPGTTKVILEDYDASNSQLLFSYSTGAYNNEGAPWGFQGEPTIHRATSQSVEENVTTEVKKLYGSVNGQSKLIKKLYGSVNGQTKLIYEG